MKSLFKVNKTYRATGNNGQTDFNSVVYVVAKNIPTAHTMVEVAHKEIYGSEQLDITAVMLVSDIVLF